MSENLSQEQLLAAFQLVNEHSDEEVALLVAIYVQEYSPVLPSPETLAAGMLIFTGRRVTVERAEHLVEILREQGLVAEDGDDPSERAGDGDEP